MRHTRRGRPSLVGTMARTAVIAGTATAVSSGVSGAMNNSAQQKATAQQAMAQQQAAAQQAQLDAAVQQALAQQQAAQAAVAAPAAPALATGGLTDENIAQLKKLAELQQAGILTTEEFEAQKAKILAS